MRFILFLVSLLICAHSVAARTFYVDGAGGVPLSVTEAGPQEAPGILFLHGIGQGKESFRYQFDSALTDKFHLVAFDLRGHGSSGKPWREADYTDTAIWAEDVLKVMDATGLTRPVIVAWSYGGGVAADLIRATGTKRISGLVLIGSLGGFVKQDAPSGPLPPELVRARKLQTYPGLSEQLESSRLIMPMLTESVAPAEWKDAAVVMGAMVPAYARDSLRKHPFNNTDLMSRLDIPVLIAHGVHDVSVPQKAVDAFLKIAPKAQAIPFASAGHSPFVEMRERFNDELSKFVRRAVNEDPKSSDTPGVHHQQKAGAN